MDTRYQNKTDKEGGGTRPKNFDSTYRRLKEKTRPTLPGNASYNLTPSRRDARPSADLITIRYLKIPEWEHPREGRLERWTPSDDKYRL